MPAAFDTNYTERLETKGSPTGSKARQDRERTNPALAGGEVDPGRPTVRLAMEPGQLQTFHLFAVAPRTTACSRDSVMRYKGNNRAHLRNRPGLADWIAPMAAVS